jgi:hypothetical protein
MYVEYLHATTSEPGMDDMLKRASEKANVIVLEAEQY